MRSTTPCAVLATLLLTGVLHADTLRIDPMHSSVGFKVRHLFSNVLGHFSEFSGVIEAEPEHPENSTVTCTIEAKSIDTGVAKRDAHLKSPDFFDADKFPTLVFKSKKVSVLGADSADVLGDFTLHGVTKEVTLHVKFLGKGKGMQGGLTTGWEGTTQIKRSDFGLKWNKVIEGAQVVADDVDIDLQISADAKAK